MHDPRDAGRPLRRCCRTRSVGQRPSEGAEGKEAEEGDTEVNIADEGRRRASALAAGRSQDGVLQQRLGSEDGRDRLAAIVRDPRTVFLHWELAGPRSADAVRLLGPDCRWCVRLLNLTDGTSTAIPVDPQARHHYLEVTPGTTYAFELAATDTERWRPVCRTERVGMPPAEPRAGALRSGPGGVRWPAHLEVAGLRFETTAVHLGSSSRPKPPAQKAEVEAVQKDG